ncbi:MAG: 4'-phosphopantetheinyl transferase superfamily protein [Bacteroidota bacterium]|nr:4'-phosphopantetheinyl transferase superfamily protein [Bacteroidota bacterium]MDX5431922.1 4'-phosphopantetheinyl transferase superfamily protein [Bacteroidota bacterium]MDX5470637.1 4'-phosphopantetheinyl transferase superfamily protein [Bacteroidota bacterium]
MPKVWQKYTNSGSLIGLWEISEPLEELESSLKVEPLPELKNENRKRQFLGSRLLLQTLLEEVGVSQANLAKRDDGRPFLMDSPWELSISHTDRMAAVALSKKPIGIDIELMSERIKRIQSKFMNQEELDELTDENDLRWMHLVWSAKEALFKYHPERDFDFREHLRVHKASEIHLDAIIKKSLEPEHLRVFYHFFKQYVLTWTEI